jgi:sulfur-oxidizing protein SoxY
VHRHDAYREKKMSDRVLGNVVGRRELLLGAGAATMVAVLSAIEPVRAIAKDGDTNGWESLLTKLTGEQTPTEGKIAFDIVETAENGNTVPFAVSVESLMDETHHVKAIHVVATGNPQPSVATFYFTPDSGKAMVASRMRLAESQNVICLAEFSDGKFAIAKKMVKVTIGGCGS